MTALPRFAVPTLSPGLSAAMWSACAALVLAVIAHLALGDGDVEGYRVAFRFVGAAFVACGLIAWRRRPDSYSGLLMTATGFLLFVEPLSALFGSPEVTVMGALFEDLWSITIVWLLLTMLSGGRIVTTAERVLVGAFVVEFVLTFVSALYWERDGNFLLVRADQGTADAFETARALLVSVACVAIAVVIGLRWRRASRPRRRAMLPSVAGISVLVFFAVAQQAEPIWLRWLAVLSRSPSRPASSSACCARGSRAAASPTSSASFRRCGAAQLRGGARARDRGPEPARGLRGRPPRARHDRTPSVPPTTPSLDDDPELVEAVSTAAASIAVENERLQKSSRRRASASCRRRASAS